jgi:ferredoxin
VTGSHDVTLERADGSDRTIEVETGETVLEASERTERTVPFGCRTGACGTCAGRLLEVGEAGDDGDGDATDGSAGVADAFEYRREPRALKPRHREAGYVLLCIALPRADCRVAVGSKARRDLVDNPWK